MTAVEELAREHRTILDVVGLLEATATHIERGGHVEPAMLGNLLGLCEWCIHASHVVKEEQGLFPLLEARGLGPETTAVAAIHAQHQTAAVFLREMRAAANRLPSGDAQARREFQVWVRDYVGLVREHIRIEDEYFYSLAQGALEAADDATLRARFDRIDRATNPPEEAARCRALVERYREVAAAW